jgi:Ni/Fe-hydrogenase subunit HybB-like protein
MVTIGIVAFEILCYKVLVKLLPVLPRLHGRDHAAPPPPLPPSN